MNTVNRSKREIKQLLFQLSHKSNITATANNKVPHTNKCAACLLACVRDALDDLCRHSYFESPARKVVEEEQRLGALTQHVVDTHGHEILAKG